MLLRTINNYFLLWPRKDQTPEIICFSVKMQYKIGNIKITTTAQKFIYMYYFISTQSKAVYLTRPEKLLTGGICSISRVVLHPYFHFFFS